MKKKSLITRILEGAIVETPYYDEVEFPDCKTSLGVYIPKQCTLQDYETCKNYKGSKKIPICPNCAYRGNIKR